MITRDLKGRDFITLRDFNRQEIETMLEIGLRLKADNKMRRSHQDILPVRTLLMMFFNPSLRTRNSFEAGIFQLGGHAHFLEPSSSRLPTLEGEDVPYQSERIADMARVLSRMGDAIAIRILGGAVDWEYEKSLRIIEEFAKYSDVPVINMEDNKYHPCQGMADAMTLWENLGEISGVANLPSRGRTHLARKSRSLLTTTSCTPPATSDLTSSSLIRRR